MGACTGEATAVRELIAVFASAGVSMLCSRGRQWWMGLSGRQGFGGSGGSGDVSFA